MSDDNGQFAERVVEAVRGYLREQYPERTGEVAEIDASESLVERDLIDSLTFLGLVELLEEEFGVEVPPDDFAPDLFETLDDIASYVAEARKQ